MQDVQEKLNIGLSSQKQHSTRRLFPHQQTGLKFEQEH